MRIAISYSAVSRESGGRLRHDLARRMPRDEVLRERDGGGCDALVALVASSTFETTTDDRVRCALAAAGRADTVIVLVTIGGASVPPPEQLPPDLAYLADLDPVSASDEYWDAAVERVAERIASARTRPSGRLATLSRASRRLRIGAAVSVIGGVVGILATFGVFASHPRQQGSIKVVGGAASGLTYERYLRDFGTANDKPERYRGPKDNEGYVYDIEVALDNPEGSRYGLRWTARDSNQQQVIASAGRDVLAQRLSARRATGLHHIWVPCPSLSGQPYVVQFTLVDESATDQPPLDSDISPQGSCRALG